MENPNNFDGGESFDAFQIEEYKTISSSHFESIKQVSIFFRYYLLILAAPVFILTIINNEKNGLKLFLTGQEPLIYYNIVFLYFILIAFIGYFIFLYVVNLRHDAILYARTVNNVRRYFYHKSDLKPEDYEQFLLLPIVSTKPKYSQKTFFIPILLLFSFINCGLLSAGLFIKGINSAYIAEWILPFNLPINNLSIFVFTFFFFLFHFASYFYLADNRNNRYLRHYAFGVDIDGVLSDQTTHFVKWLEKLTGKIINLTEIKEIPVHLNESLGITNSDERTVFSTKEYWEQLPVKNKAVERLMEFQKKFGYRIYFFSYRDWPQYGSEETEILEMIKSKGYTPLKKGEIAEITKKWLNKNKINAHIVSDRWSAFMYRMINTLSFTKKRSLVIEMGNPYISDTRFWNQFRKAILNRNRFQGAKLKGFRFFIEDTPENAIKLSTMCDYVFMFDEPYNSDESYRFPKNVLRVKSWDDIYRHMKRLS
jgi:uncharacterized HAD superfamily protein